MSRISRMNTKIGDIDAQILALQQERRKLQAQQAERLGKFAIESGLGEVNITDDQLKAAFAEVAARFRAAPDTPKPSAAPAAAEVPEPN